jgi:hypothetical protein
VPDSNPGNRASGAARKPGALSCCGEAKNARGVALSRRLDLEVHMRRATRMAAARGQPLANGPIGRYRIGHRQHAAKTHPPLGIATQHAASAQHIAVLVLDIVVAVLVGLPDVDGRMRGSHQVIP